MTTDAVHTPTQAEREEFWREPDLFALAKTIATPPVLEDAAVIEQRILSLYIRGGLTDDKLVVYYQRNAASWTKLTRDQIIGYRDALAGKLWLLTAFDRHRKPGDPNIWVIAR